jgi:tetratricopeptide (TPR) repeat protein
LHSLGHALGNSRRHAAALELHEAALDVLDRLGVGDEPNRVENLKDVAECLDSLGRHAEALPKAEQALAMVQRSHDHHLVATTLSTFAGCLDSLGRSAEALPNHEQALAMRLRLHPLEHPDVASAYNNLGACLKSLGRYEDALNAFQQALAIRERIINGDHPRLLTNLGNVGGCLQSLSRHAEALALFEQGLAMARRIYPEDHAQVALLLHHVAEARRKAGGDIAAAEREAQSAVAMYRSHPEWDTPEYVHALSVLAEICEGHGRPAEAATLWEEIMRSGAPGRQVQWGAERAATLSRLGPLLWKADQNCEAEARLREGLALTRAVHGDTDHRTAFFLLLLAGVVEELGRVEEAESMGREAVEIYHTLGAEHLDAYRLAVEKVLGKVLPATGKHDAWDSVRRRFIEWCREKLPPEHPEITEQLTRLGLALQQDRMNYADAEPILREALDWTRTANGERAPRVAFLQHHLADCLRATHRLPEAERLARDAVALYRELADEQVLEHQHAVFILARTLEQSGKSDEAISARREFLASCGTVLPPGHAERRHTLAPLALALLERRQFTEAEPILRELLSIREQTLELGSPEFWLLAQSRTMLGEALVGQAALPVSEPEASATGHVAALTPGARIDRLLEAEPLIVESYDWLSTNFERINPALALQLRQERVRPAGARIVKLYETWHAAEPGGGYAEKVAEWRAKLESETPLPNEPTPGPSP